MTGARVTAEGVTVRFGRVTALRDARVTAAPGRVLALIGASGAGKSTLLRVLHLILPPTSGHVTLDGTPAPGSGRARADARRRFALVQQRPGLLRGSAVDNVAYPLRVRGVARPEARRRARTALAEAGLASRADAPVHELSGGEAQRTVLGRALVTHPDVLLLDEFTNHLDPENEARAEDMVTREAARGATVVVVTHNVAQARRLADDAAFLDAGRVLEHGPADAVLTAPRTPLVRRFVARA